MRFGWKRWMPESLVHKCAAISGCVMWILAGVVHAQTADHDVRHTAVMISLPVYVVSLVATASFTWAVAKYDNERIRRMDRLERTLQAYLHSRGEGNSPENE